MIYLGDHEIQGIYAGDLLIYPDTPEPPTPTGSTYTLNTVYHATANTLPPLGYNWAVILHKQYIQSAYNTDILTKAELSGGTEIPINTTYTEFTTSGNNIVNYTFTGSTLTPNLFMETDLVSIAIPSGVTEIQYDCFWGCNRLTAVTISDSVTTIGSEAFGQCILLPTITIPSGVTSIGVRVFSGCTGMQEMIFQGTTPPTLGSDGLGSTGYTFPIYVPCEAVETYKTAYPAYASRITCVGLETRLAVTYNVTSTTSTTKIIYTGTTDFLGAELEDGTVIPVSKAYTFPQTGLTKVYYTLSGTSIPEQAFYGLKNIVGVELPSSGLEEIGAYAFRNCGSITGVVTIPNNVTVGSSAFTQCSAVTSIDISSGCNIGTGAFYRDSGLTSVTIANDCNIGESAFNRCFGLADITIGSGCDIGTSAFTQCSGLTEVAIPSDTTVGNFAFSQCTGLTGITLPNECEIGEGGFSRCSGLTQVTIPSNSNLSTNAFSGCTGLTDVTVQSGATLGYRAFYSNFYIKRVTIGPGVSFVSGATFSSTGYEEVIIEGTPPQSKPSEMVFRGGGTNPYPIYVQDNQVDAWKQWFDLGPGTYSKEPVRFVVPISERALIPNTYKRLAYCGPYARTMTYVEANYPESGFNESMWVEYEFELRKIPTGTTEVHVFSGDNYRFAQIDTAGNWSVRRGGNSVSITTSPFPDAGSDDVYSARTYSFFKNGDNIEVDGVVVGSVTDPGTSPDSIHPRFFSVNGSDDYATYGADGFLYRAKVGNKDEGSSLIAHYVPAQRRSDDVYGLWDFVTSTFLPVNNGTSGN